MATTTSSGNAVVTLPTDTQILIRREFAAPKHLVYKAWTTPELIRRWWAGNMGKVTMAEVDLRVGGKWRYVMVTDKGFEVAFHGEYRDLVENERIVSTEVYEGIPNADEAATLNTLTLTESSGRTALDIVVQCQSQEQRDAIIASGMETGLQQSLDHLERVAVSLI